MRLNEVHSTVRAEGMKRDVRQFVRWKWFSATAFSECGVTPLGLGEPARCEWEREQRSEVGGLRGNGGVG